MDCPFCELAKTSNREIIRTNLSWVFPTNIPIVPGHILICPIRCVKTLAELTSEELIDFFDLQKRLKLVLEKTFAAEGFNYAWNEGQLAGQSVGHLHLHMLPRKLGDAGVIDYDPRKFLYRPGSRSESPEAELEAVAQLIKSHL